MTQGVPFKHLNGTLFLQSHANAFFTSLIGFIEQKCLQLNYEKFSF